MTTLAERLDKGETMDEMWKGFYGMTMPFVSPDSQQYLDMQGSFYAGALCLFNWMMVQLDSDADPTEADLDKISAIDEEIKDYFNRYDAIKGTEQ